MASLKESSPDFVSQGGRTSAGSGPGEAREGPRVVAAQTARGVGMGERASGVGGAGRRAARWRGGLKPRVFRPPLCPLRGAHGPKPLVGSWRRFPLPKGSGGTSGRETRPARRGRTP